MIERLLEAERALTVGMLDHAERIYQMAVDADPRNSIAVVGLARVAIERGDDVRAYAMGMRALDIDGDNQAARRLVDRLLEVRAARGEGPPVAAAPADVSAAPRATNGRKASEPATQSAEASAVAVAAPPKPADPAPAARTAPKADLPAKPESPAKPDLPAKPDSPPKSERPTAAAPDTPRPPKPSEPAKPVAPPVAPPLAPPIAPPAQSPVAVTPATEPPRAAPQPRAVTPVEAPKGLPEAPATNGRTGVSVAARKSKVVQPATIRTSGARRASAAPQLVPPQTALPKARPLLPPEPEPDGESTPASAGSKDEPRLEPRPRTPKVAARPTRTPRAVEPKQPGLFDRLFRPKR
jgi:hypothetical protein